jgi:hypothetical protein
MKTFLVAISAISVLAGCATSEEYLAYAKTQEAIALQRAAAETARYNALAEIARSSDTTAKVAAVMSLNGFGNTSQQPQTAMVAPASNSETALRWLGLLLPSVVQGYGIYQNGKVAITQSNNSAAIALKQSDNDVLKTQSTNGAFVDITKLTTQYTPTVVNQPAPTIVTQPAPIIVTQPEPTIVNPVIVPVPTPVTVGP